jgi:hypothetical protein
MIVGVPLGLLVCFIVHVRRGRRQPPPIYRGPVGRDNFNRSTRQEGHQSAGDGEGERRQAAAMAAAEALRADRAERGEGEDVELL